MKKYACRLNRLECMEEILRPIFNRRLLLLIGTSFIAYCAMGVIDGKLPDFGFWLKCILGILFIAFGLRYKVLWKIVRQNHSVWIEHGNLKNEISGNIWTHTPDQLERIKKTRHLLHIYIRTGNGALVMDCRIPRRAFGDEREEEVFLSQLNAREACEESDSETKPEEKQALLTLRVKLDNEKLHRRDHEVAHAIRTGDIQSETGIWTVAAWYMLVALFVSFFLHLLPLGYYMKAALICVFLSLAYWAERISFWGPVDRNREGQRPQKRNVNHWMIGAEYRADFLEDGLDVTGSATGNVWWPRENITNLLETNTMLCVYNESVKTAICFFGECFEEGQRKQLLEYCERYEIPLVKVGKEVEPKRDVAGWVTIGVTVILSILALNWP